LIGSPDNLSQFGGAFAHALFDGLWAGAAVAVAMHLFLRMHRGLNAASRHAAWYAALIVIAAMPVVSFGASLARINISAAPTQLATQSMPAAVGAARAAPAIGIQSDGLAQTASAAAGALWNSDFARDAAIAAAIVAAAIALARISLLLTGLFGLAIVKRASRIVDPAIAPSLARSIASDPRARPVDVRISETIDAPAAAGFRTPAILLPAALFESLDLEAIDQIAMHEYAHLRRYDDWTNLAQRFLERLYWFNPAIWFVAGRIDLDREIACDDWVIAGAKGVSGYADCLWQLARDGRVPAFAATAPGAFLTRNQIVARIEHLLERPSHGEPFWRPSKLLAVAPVLAAALALVITRAPAIAVHVDAAPVASARVVTPVDVQVVAVRSTIRSRTETVATTARTAAPAVAAPAPTICPARVRERARSAAHEIHQAVHGAIAGHFPSMERTMLRSIRHAIHDSARAASAGSAASREAHEAAAAIVAASDVTDNAPTGAMNRNMLAHCTGCDLSGQDLRNADLHDLSLTGDNLSDSDLRGANLRNAILTGVDLSNAKLDGADLRGASLTGTDIDGATFSGAKVDGIRLVGMQLTNAILATSSVRAIIGDCAGCDLSGLDLHGRDLHGITLDGADLHGVDLSGANLSGARFNGVDFSGAKFDGANLRNASMNGCNLEDVDLSRAHTDGLLLHGTTVGDHSHASAPHSTTTG
jgi:uncharacterized protein YjbI with pentapeptide repeats/beta-lactamase regulating signal transducer with metallopeptidase domain